MIDAKTIKQIALEAGADEVGIATMALWEGAPQQMDPRYAMPRAKSMIVMTHRIMRGSLRGVEEGTYYSSYSAMGYGYINQKVFPWTAREVARALEDEGYESMPLAYHFYGGAINTNDGKTWKSGDGFSVPVRAGLPRADVYMSIRIAAFLAGLGEIGYSKVFLSKKFGPRVRIGCVLTDMELEPDPIMPPGTLCNRCLACVRQCPGQAISATKTMKINVAGYDIEWGELNEAGCNRAFVGAQALSGDDDPADGDYLKAPKGFKPSFISPFKHKPDNIHVTGQAICGGRGCMRACMISLENRGVLDNTFKEKFRRRPAWTVDWAKVGEPGAAAPEA